MRVPIRSRLSSQAPIPAGQRHSRNRLAPGRWIGAGSAPRLTPPPRLPPGSSPHSGACPVLPPFHSGPLIRLQRQRRQPERARRHLRLLGLKLWPTRRARGTCAEPELQDEGWDSCQPRSEPGGRATPSPLGITALQNLRSELGALVGWTCGGPARGLRKVNIGSKCKRQ